MEFFDLVNISERNLEIVNPSNEENIMKLGRALRLKPGMSVIDFGCGYGETLAIWAEAFSIRGTGIDIRPHACERAEKKMRERGLSDQIGIVCSDAKSSAFKENSFDAAICIGATFAWGDFRDTLQACRRAIKPDGRIGIGELFWRHLTIPQEVLAKITLPQEIDLIKIIRGEECELETIVRSTQLDWDHYQNENWIGLIQWLEENPHHPERDQVIEHLRGSQEEYLSYGRECFEWAMFAIGPAAN